MTSPFRFLMARLFGHHKDVVPSEIADLQRMLSEIDEQLSEIYCKLAKAEHLLLRVQNHLPQTPCPGKSRKEQPSSHTQGTGRFYREYSQVHEDRLRSASAQAILDEL